MSKPDHNFIYQCRGAVRTMREAGINETLIACVVTEIRSAAISEEWRRLENVRSTNLPTHFPHGDIADAIAVSIPPAKQD